MTDNLQLLDSEPINVLICQGVQLSNILLRNTYRYASIVIEPPVGHPISPFPEIPDQRTLNAHVRLFH